MAADAALNAAVEVRVQQLTAGLMGAACVPATAWSRENIENDRTFSRHKPVRMVAAVSRQLGWRRL